MYYNFKIVISMLWTGLCKTCWGGTKPLQNCRSYPKDMSWQLIKASLRNLVFSGESITEWAPLIEEFVAIQRIGRSWWRSSTYHWCLPQLGTWITLWTPLLGFWPLSAFLLSERIVLNGKGLGCRVRKLCWQITTWKGWCIFLTFFFCPQIMNCFHLWGMI